MASDDKKRKADRKGRSKAKRLASAPAKKKAIAKVAAKVATIGTPSLGKRSPSIVKKVIRASLPSLNATMRKRKR